jgi:ferredoxin-NADP reductase
VVLQLPVAGRTHHNPYSLLGSPDDPYWTIAVRLQETSRGGSSHLHRAVGVGQRLRVDGPVNLFPFARTARRHLLFAGGIGITPILGHARELARLNADFEVHYAVRSAEFAVYRDELERLAPGRLHVYLDAEGARPDYPRLLAAQCLGTHLYVCGPAGMIEACLASARACGWPGSHLHSEQFLAPAHGDAFQVRAERSGIELTVAADMSLLDALEQAGLEPPCLCRGGACGQCEAEVLSCEGELDHRDIYLSAAEKASGKKIMPCVSRLRSGRLVLNL